MNTNRFTTVMSVFSSLRYCLGDPHDHGAIWAALGFMPFGLFFDFMDGRIARWRKKSSLMGQELDSLADLVGLILSLITQATKRLFFRFPSVWPRPQLHSLLESEPLSITYFFHSSCSAA